MMATKKRLIDEFDAITHANPSKCAKVQGVVSSISPMKPSSSGTSRYFDGELSDGQTTLRLVGFDNKQQQKLAEFQDKQEPVSLIECEVKPGKWGSQLEVIIGRNTQVIKSPTKFDVTVPPACQSMFDDMSLDELQNKINYQRVKVQVKILDEKAVMEVKHDLMKQDYIVGDATGITTLTTWKNNTGMFEVGQSYELSGVMVKDFNGKKYLSVPKENCKVSIIDNIEDVKDMDEATQTERNFKNATVIGVMSLETYNSCKNCKGKVEVTSRNIGQCRRCGMIQRLDKCKIETSAKLMVEAGEHIYTLTAFTPILQKMCHDNAISEEELLGAEELINLTYSETNVILNYDN